LFELILIPFLCIGIFGRFFGGSFDILGPEEVKLTLSLVYG
jgi:hypothetical protein